MRLRVEARLEIGFGTSFAFSPADAWWAATTTNSTNLWRGLDLAHAISVTGHVAGRDRFSADGATLEVGCYTIDVASGELTRWAGDAPWLTATVDDPRADPVDFAAPLVVHVPDRPRAVVRTEYLLPRERGRARTISGPHAQLLLIDSARGVLIAELVHDAARHRLADGVAALVAAAGRRELQTWSSESGEPIGAWSADDLIDAISVAPDAGRVATLGRAGDATLWTPTGDRLCTWHAHDGAGAALAWAPSGEWVATGSRDGRLGVWDLTSSSPELLAEHAAASIGGIGVRPDDHTLLVGGDVVDQGITMLAWDH